MGLPVFKNIYVLFGGSGFIGTNIYNKLLNEHTFFIVIDKESKLRLFDDIPEELKSHVLLFEHHLDYMDEGGTVYIETLIKKSIREITTSYMYTIKWNITYVHLASTVGVVSNISGNFRSEMRITQNVIQIIKNLLVSTSARYEKINICYTSTSELFGENSHKISKHLSYEDQEKLFDLSCLYSPKFSERSEYIYQKYIGEKLFASLKHQKLPSQVQVFILRLFNIVGPYQDTRKGVFSKFIVNIILGKQSICSESIRRYVPITAVTDFFNPYSKSLFGNAPKGTTSIMFTGNDKLLCGTGEELYMHIYNYIKKKYPTCKGLTKCTYILDKGQNKNGVDEPKEIRQRFEKRIITNEEFEKQYGFLIDGIIQMQIKYGPLTVDALGIKNVKEQEEVIKEETFPGVVTHYKDGLAIIEGLKDICAGDLILFENEEKGILSDADSEKPTCVILGRGDNIPIGLRCKLNGKLKFPDIKGTRC